MPSECKLCHKQDDLTESHIIPKFVGTWIKKTSANGYFTAIDNVGQIKRSQDITKVRLLCGNCEAILNDFETYFANTIFYPFQNHTLPTISKDERLGKFAVSVSLRVLWILREINDCWVLKWKDELLELEKEWCAYILDAKDFTKGLNSHHIIFPSKEILSAALPEHPNIILNLMRTSVFYLYEKFGKAYIFSNMAGVQIISMISPPRLPVSKGTEVYPVQTLGTEQPGIGWGGYFQNLIGFNTDLNELRKKISPNYSEIIEKSIQKDPMRVLNSEDMKIIAEQEFLLKYGTNNKPDTIT